MSEPARTGKIARLPVDLRDEVNRRLLDGEPASKILPWLNGLEVVLRVLDEHFNEEPITPQNLSEWRQGGYQDWLKRREHVARLKDLSTYAAKLGEAAGGNTTDGSAAILGGRILERLEAALNAGDDDTMAAMVKPLVLLRMTDQEAHKARQRDRVIGQRDKALEQRERAVALDEKRFEVRTCELFVKWAEDKRALEIAQGRDKPEVKVEKLRQLMFFGEPDAPATA